MAIAVANADYFKDASEGTKSGLVAQMRNKASAHCGADIGVYAPQRWPSSQHD
jgi:hypothetical protein